jgi:hypothetical protein
MATTRRQQIVEEDNMRKTDLEKFDGLVARTVDRLLYETERRFAAALPPTHDSLHDRCTAIAGDMTLDKIDGADLADEIIDDVIGILRRAFPDRSNQALELMLADLRADTARKLGDFVAGLIDRDVFVRDLVNELTKSPQYLAHPPRRAAAQIQSNGRRQGKEKTQWQT